MMTLSLKVENSLGSYERLSEGSAYRKMGYSESPITDCHEAPLVNGDDVSRMWCSKCRFKNGGITSELLKEYFISKMKIGDRFFFAGEIWNWVWSKKWVLMFKVFWKEAKNVVKLDGARMSLSSKLAEKIREIVWEDYNKGIAESEEIRRVFAAS